RRFQRLLPARNRLLPRCIVFSDTRQTGSRSRGRGRTNHARNRFTEGPPGDAESCRFRARKDGDQAPPESLADVFGRRSLLCKTIKNDSSTQVSKVRQPKNQPWL